MPIACPTRNTSRQYATVPHFVWQARYPEPEYRKQRVRAALCGLGGGPAIGNNKRFPDFLPVFVAKKFVIYFNTAFATPLMFLSLIAIPWVFPFEPIPPGRAFVLVLLFASALLPETYVQQHYAAPAAGLVNLLCVQGLRYIRCLRRPRPIRWPDPGAARLRGQPGDDGALSSRTWSKRSGEWLAGSRQKVGYRE